MGMIERIYKDPELYAFFNLLTGSLMSGQLTVKELKECVELASIKYKSRMAEFHIEKTMVNETGPEMIIPITNDNIIDIIIKENK